VHYDAISGDNTVSNKTRKNIAASVRQRLLCYNRESAIAEKFEAMVKLRELDPREGLL
jgi:hypothetical protein